MLAELMFLLGNETEIFRGDKIGEAVTISFLHGIFLSSMPK